MTKLSLIPLLVAVAALGTACRATGGGAQLRDDADEAVLAKAAATLDFPGPKAKLRAAGDAGIAAKPTGTLAKLKAGDVIAVSYAPQRIRGCDGGGWAQATTISFLDASGKPVGGAFYGSGFGGLGMVPSAQAPLLMPATVPPGAVQLHLESVNNGEKHEENDVVGDSPDAGGAGDNFSAGGSACSDDAAPGVTGWNVPLTN